MAAPTMQTMEAAPAAVPVPSVPPGARETLARNIADTRLRIDGYQRFVRAVGRLRARGTDAPTVCRSAFDRTFAGDDSQLQHLASGIERARDSMCELHTEILSPPPDRVRSLERLRANFDRRRRDLRNRRPDVLAPADLEELLRRVDAVEVAMQPTPPRCASPSHEALRSYARNLGPRAAQPALQIGYSVGRVCTRPLQLPSRELGYLQAMERSQSAAEENIRIHSDILARLQQIHYP